MKHLHFKISEELIDELDQIKDAMGLADRREFFAVSIGVMRWCTQQSRLGKKIGSVDSEGKITDLNLSGFDIIRNGES